jgi:hypothetical protein
MARRLLFILLVMLVVSSVAAALVPVERDEDAETTEPDPAVERDPKPRGGRAVEATVDAGRKQPSIVRLELGDRLLLTVKADRFAEIEIPALGELADAEPGTPAVFDLIPPDAGRFAVRLLENGTHVATIVVRKRDRDAG